MKTIKFEVVLNEDQFEKFSEEQVQAMAEMLSNESVKIETLGQYFTGRVLGSAEGV